MKEQQRKIITNIIVNKCLERWTESTKGKTTYMYLLNIVNIRERLDMHWIKPDKWGLKS